MRQPPGFMAADPADDGFQHLEDLACAYWYSETLFAALDLQLFALLGRDGRSLASLAEAASVDRDVLFRLLRALERISLVVRSPEERWFNSRAAARFLVPGEAEYLGDFLLYRRYMQGNWRKLTARLAPGKPEADDATDYRERNFRYARAMDALARQKAPEIVDRLPLAALLGPVLDAGGGAGSLIRALRARRPDLAAVLFDIPEVIEAARRLHPYEADWGGITTIAGDFRDHRFGERFGLVILANFLHAYGRAEARELLEKAVGLLVPGGRLLIHDYFPDRRAGSPHKGALYDLTMMLNTYNGACHESGTVLGWLAAAGLIHCGVCDLTTDSSLILAGREPGEGLRDEPWLAAAKRLGFDRASVIDPREVVTGSWVAMKCRFGCGNYGENRQCPPLAIPHHETRRMLDEYRIALLVEGQPPGRQFHEMLLALEKEVFLAGRHKALVFGAGPCTLCPDCPPDGSCRRRDLARPSMEAAGIDVYATAAKVGWPLAPVREKGGYVKYLGLLLVE